MKLTHRGLILGGQRKDQPPLADRKAQAIGAGRNLAPVAHGQAKAVVFQKVEDRDLALLLDLGRGAGKAAFVDLDMADAVHQAVRAFWSCVSALRSGQGLMPDLSDRRKN